MGTKEERLTGDNQYLCGFCKGKRDAVKQLSIFEAPNVLVVHLKRFEFGSKIDAFVRFGERLEMTRFLSRETRRRVGGVTYGLYGVVVHSGKYSDCGHYVSFVRTASGRWYLCNDSIVQATAASQVLRQKGY